MQNKHHFSKLTNLNKESFKCLRDWKIRPSLAQNFSLNDAFWHLSLELIFDGKH